jgi:hypothetical protein
VRESAPNSDFRQNGKPTEMSSCQIFLRQF